MSIDTPVGTRHENAVDILQMASSPRVVSLYLCIVRILRKAFPFILAGIVREIVPKNYSNNVIFKALSRVNRTDLFHS